MASTECAIRPCSSHQLLREALSVLGHPRDWPCSGCLPAFLGPWDQTLAAMFVSVWLLARQELLPLLLGAEAAHGCCPVTRAVSENHTVPQLLAAFFPMVQLLFWNWGACLSWTYPTKFTQELCAGH